MRFRISIIIAIAALFFVGAAHAQHGTTRPSQGHGTGPAMKTELDNDQVQVVRVHLDPYQKVPMHDVTPRVVIWVTGAHLRATSPDGRSREEQGTPGQVDWVPAQRHAAENLDGHPVEFIAVIPKARAGSGHLPE